MKINNKNENPASTAERVTAGLIILSGFAGAWMLWFFNPTTAGFFPACPLHTMTGLNCPGCGMTRGFHQLFHGDISGALHFNALLPFFILFFGYLFVSLFLTFIRGRGLSFGIFKPKVIYAFMLLAMVFFLVRNLPFYPFNYLAI